MKKQLIVTMILFILGCGPAISQEDVSLFGYWQYNSDVKNSLYKNFCTIAFDQLESRKTEIDKLKTKSDWLERQSVIRKKIAKAAGPFPEKTPLNARVTGVIKKDGYSIEKILYESRPGYYVTSALYIPGGVKKNAPAIFYACGHSRTGFRAETYQHIIINLVKKGFVVFTIDPMGQGERFEYWDKETDEPKYPIPDHEHSFAGAQCLISGYATASYFIWDAIRGIDYMHSRKEIDKNRIGMTGRSGGGNITAYVGALDDRVLATAPECYITSYKYIYKSIGPQCAEQNLYKMVHEGLDHADFIEARAPKPTLIISTTRDFFSIQGTRDSYLEAKRMYKTLEFEKNLMMVEDDSVHKSTRKNREAMYAFFQSQLNNPGSPADNKVNIPSIDELRVTPTGQLVTSFDKQSIFSLNKSTVKGQIEALNRSRTDQDTYLGKVSLAAVTKSGFKYPEEFGSPVFSGRYTRSNYTSEKYLVQGSGNYAMPVVLLQPINSSKKEIVLIVDSEGMENAANSDSLAYSLVEEGYSVLLFDLPGIGSMWPGYLKGDSYIGNTSYNQWFAAMLAGKSNVGLRTQDIIRITHFAKYDQGYSNISALSMGPLGGELLHAATFELELSKIGLIRPFMSYEDIATTKLYEPGFIPFTVPGAIEEYDLPDLIAGLCPRKVLVINPLSADGEEANYTKAEKIMQFPMDVYSKKGSPKNFNLIKESNKQVILDELLSWLE